MSHDHDHGARQAGERSLWLALALTAGYMVAEVAGGLLTSSLALISDAAHMFTDAAALAIALAAIHIARRAADHKRTFGYHRFEILAAALNALVLLGVGCYVLYEAYLRLREPPAIHSAGMLTIGAVGFAVNYLGMRLLRHGAQTSLNMRSAYLEMWSDMLGSLGVVAAAIVIHFTGWGWVDALVAAAIALWIVPRCWALLRESLHILLEGVPPGLSLHEIQSALSAVPGVQDVHDLHVWALTSGRNSLTVHLVLDEGKTPQDVLQDAARMLEKRFGLTHTTIQVEVNTCEQAFACDPHGGEHAHDGEHHHHH
jgi:cobalt-zinc-cadmium efflux system protein